MDPERDDGREVSKLQEDWILDSRLFLSERLGLSSERIEEYERASLSAFSQYQQEIESILALAKETYGANVAVVIEGYLQKEYDKAWHQYEEALEEKIGERTLMNSGVSHPTRLAYEPLPCFIQKE